MDSSFYKAMYDMEKNNDFLLLMKYLHNPPPPKSWMLIPVYEQLFFR